MNITLHNELNDISNENIQFLAINKNPISITSEPFANEDGDYIKGRNLLAISSDYTCIGTTKSVKIISNIDIQNFFINSVFQDTDNPHSMSGIGKDIEFEEDILDVRVFKFNEKTIFVVVLTNGSLHLVYQQDEEWSSHKQSVDIDIDDINDFSTVYKLSQNELIYLNKGKQLFQLSLNKKDDYMLEKALIYPDHKGIKDFEYKSNMGLVFIDDDNLYISKSLTATPEKYNLHDLEIDSKDFYKLQFISDKCISVSFTNNDEGEIEEELDFAALETKIISFDQDSVKVTDAELVAEADAIIPDAYNVISTSLKDYVPEYNYFSVLGTSKSSSVQMLTVSKDKVSLEQCFEDQYNVYLPMTEEGDDTTVKGLSFSLCFDFKDELTKRLEFDIKENTPILFVLTSDLKLLVYFVVFVDQFKNEKYNAEETMKLFESGLYIKSEIQDDNKDISIQPKESMLDKFITDDGKLKPPTKVDSPPIEDKKPSGLFSSMANIIEQAQKPPVFGETNVNPFSIGSQGSSPFGDFGKNVTLGKQTVFGQPQFNANSSSIAADGPEEKSEPKVNAFAGFSNNVSPFAQLNFNGGENQENDNKISGNPFSIDTSSKKSPFANFSQNTNTSLNFSNVKDILPSNTNDEEGETDDKDEKAQACTVEDKSNEVPFNNSYTTINTSEDIDEGQWVEIGDEKSIYNINKTSDILEEPEEIIDSSEKDDSTLEAHDLEGNLSEKRPIIVEDKALEIEKKDIVSRGSQIDREVSTKVVQTPALEYKDGSVVADEETLPRDVLSKAYKFPTIEKMYVLDEKTIWDHRDKDREQRNDGIFEMMSKMVHLVDNHIMTLNMNIKILNENVKEHQKFTYEKNHIDDVKDKNVNWRFGEIKKITEIINLSFNTHGLDLKNVHEMDTKVADIMKESLLLKHDIQKSINDLGTQLKTKKVMKLSNLEEGLLNSHDTMIDSIQSKLEIFEKTLYFTKVYLALKKSLKVNDITADDVEAFLNSKTNTIPKDDSNIKPFGITKKRQSLKYKINTKLFKELKGETKKGNLAGV